MATEPLQGPCHPPSRIGASYDGWTDREVCKEAHGLKPLPAEGLAAPSKTHTMVLGGGEPNGPCCLSWLHRGDQPPPIAARDTGNIHS